MKYKIGDAVLLMPWAVMSFGRDLKVGDPFAGLEVIATREGGLFINGRYTFGYNYTLKSKSGAEVEVYEKDIAVLMNTNTYHVGQSVDIRLDQIRKSKWYREGDEKMAVIRQITKVGINGVRYTVETVNGTLYDLAAEEFEY